ncbi:hypothetical protein R1flu_024590 [Riccia fluitans]|uniref:Uncharacterized protein n=1 Tax=Riccia fluitans TaxID=41844 RepID=A0ABD1XZF0_9MARC
MGRRSSRSKPLDKKMTVDYHDWGVHLESLGWKTSKRFKAFHMEVGSVTTEAIVQNMEQIFAPPLVAEVDIQPWKKMVKNLIKLLREEQKKNWEVIEQRDYFKEKTCQLSKKVPEIAMWCA